MNHHLSSPDVFRHHGLTILGSNPKRCNSQKIANRRFRSLFGTSWEICADIWNDLVEMEHSVMAMRGVQNYHLLWALMLLKTYQTESILGGMCRGATEKTFRKWSWSFVEAVADLSYAKVKKFAFFSSLFLPCLLSLTKPFVQILLENRFKDDKGYDCLMSVDGADFMIQEPWPYKKATSSKWYTNKFAGPGLRYEVGVSILGGDIVWVNGPYLPGKVNDHTLFKEMGLLEHLEEGERVETDDGYLRLDPEFTKARSSIFHPDKHKGRRNTIRTRHETINRRMKVFQCLARKFHHQDLGKHQDCFRAVAAIVQYALERGEQIWEVEYEG